MRIESGDGGFAVVLTPTEVRDFFVFQLQVGDRLTLEHGATCSRGALKAVSTPLEN